MRELDNINKLEKEHEHYDKIFKDMAKASRIDLEEYKCQKMARYAIINLKYSDSSDMFRKITIEEFVDFLKWINDNVVNIRTSHNFYYAVKERKWSNGSFDKIESPIHWSFKNLLGEYELTTENIAEWKKVYTELNKNDMAIKNVELKLF